MSYGGYIPRFRITSEEIGKVWGKDGKAYGKALGVESKSVPDLDEDPITMSVEAARAALARIKLDPADIGAIFVGSESHPYAVKPSGTIVAEAINASPDLTVADFEFACKAGTASIQAAMGLVKGGYIKAGLAIGSDTSQGAPGDPLEYTASAGAGAFIIGSKNVIAEINDTISFTTDTPDFWRREGQTYPRHGGRFTGEPAYFKHILSCGKNLFAKMQTEPSDYDFAVFHQPNGKFPTKVSRSLGFSPEQIEAGLLCPKIGNTYSATVPLGLCAILDEAKPGDRIFAVAYGSGAGSDGFDITVTDEIENVRAKHLPNIRDIIKDTCFLDYARYAKMRGKILMGVRG